MQATIKSDRESVMMAMEENQKEVREMVMESCRDMWAGKGRDYKEFFAEMENSAGSEPFYGKSNTKILKESIEQMENNPERNIVKTLEELEELANH